MLKSFIIILISLLITSCEHHTHYTTNNTDAVCHKAYISCDAIARSKRRIIEERSCRIMRKVKSGKCTIIVECAKASDLDKVLNEILGVNEKAKE